MFCQLCGAPNPDDASRCRKCGQKLYVVSGDATESSEPGEEFDADPDGDVSFDEHLLERISILEEVVKRTAQAMRRGLGTLHQLEEKILLNHTGLLSLRQILEDRGVVERREWTELWEERLDRQLLAMEKRDRFADAKVQISALFDGDDGHAFETCLDEAERAFLAYNTERALAALERAEEIDPQNHALIFFLAEARFNQGRHDEALERFLRVLDEKPDHGESLVYAGVLLHEGGETERARDLLSAAVERDPDAFLPRFSLGAILAEAGGYEEAAEVLERAVESSDAVPQAFYLLGSCHLECGRPHAALTALEEAVDGLPESAEARLALAVAYLDRGWHRLAREAAEVSCRLRPEILEYRELVDLLQPGDARLGPTAVEALQRAEEAIFAGDAEGALAAYADAVEKDAGNPTLLVAYAMACLELGRLNEIDVALEKAREIGLSEDLEAVAGALQIESLRAQGRIGEAVELAEDRLEATDAEFAHGLFAYELAVSLAQRGDAESLLRAVEATQVAEALLDDDLRRFPLDARGWIFATRLRDLDDEAFDCLRRATELGSSARMLVHLGVACLATGDRETAREALHQARRERERGGLPERLLGAL